MKLTFKALDNLTNFSEELEIFSETIQEKGKLSFYPHREYRISQIDSFLYLYYYIKKKKKHKYIVVDIAIQNPYCFNIMDNFKREFRQYL